MFKPKFPVMVLLAVILGGCDVSSNTASSSGNAFRYIYLFLCASLGSICQNVEPVDISPPAPAAMSDSAPYTIWVAEGNSGVAMSEVMLDPGSGLMNIAPVNVFPGIHAGGITSWVGDSTQPQYGLYLWHDNKIEFLTVAASPVATITLPASGTISDFSISSDGHLGVAIMTGDTHVYLLDLVGRKNSASYDLSGAGGHPRASVISPDGATILVTDSTNGKAYLVNTAGGVSPFTITAATELGKPAVRPDGSQYWIPDVTHNGVFLFDPQNGATSAGIQGLLDPRQILFDNKGTIAYILSSPSAGFGPGSLTILDASGNTPQVLNTIKLGNQPSGLATSPEGLLFFVANSGDGNVALIGIDGKVTTFNVGQMPVGVTVTH